MGEEIAAASKKRFIDPIGLVCALAITVVVGYAAVGKLIAPNPKKFIIDGVHLDHAIAAFEILVILVLVSFHKSKLVWGAIAVMFGGFLGYTSYWTFSRGEPCGCFGGLWDPPMGVTVALDALFVVVGLVCAKRIGMGKKLMSATLVGAMIAAGAGAYYAYSNSPEKYDNELQRQTSNGDGGDETPAPRNAQEQLWVSDLLADQRALQESGEIIATLVFVYELGCSTCEIYKPDMEAYRELFDESQDFTMRVVMVSTEEAEAQAGIEVWAWEPAPIVFVARDGAVQRDVHWYSGEATPLDLIDQVYEWANDGVPMPY